MTTIEILDRIKAEYSLTSDYQLAKKLNISTSRVGNYRSGRSSMDDELILKVEDLLDMPEGALLLEMQASRTKCKDAARLFHEMSKRLLSTAAAVMLSISVSYTGFAPEASASPAVSERADSVYYVKWLRLLRALHKLRQYPLKWLAQTNNTDFLKTAQTC